jgi:hypothetical protein
MPLDTINSPRPAEFHFQSSGDVLANNLLGVTAKGDFLVQIGLLAPEDLHAVISEFPSRHKEAESLPGIQVVPERKGDSARTTVRALKQRAWTELRMEQERAWLHWNASVSPVQHRGDTLVKDDATEHALARDLGRAVSMASIALELGLIRVGQPLQLIVEFYENHPMLKQPPPATDSEAG